MVTPELFLGLLDCMEMLKQNLENTMLEINKIDIKKDTIDEHT